MSRRDAAFGVLVVAVMALSISPSAVAAVTSADISPNHQAKTDNSQFGGTKSYAWVDFTNSTGACR